MESISSCFGLACPDSARLPKTRPSMSGRQTVTGQTMPMARALSWPTRDLSVSHAVGAVVPSERSYRRLSAVELTETISAITVLAGSLAPDYSPNSSQRIRQLRRQCSSGC